MKTIGPMNAQDGNTEIAMVFSINAKKFHAILKFGGNNILYEAINDFINDEFKNSQLILTEAIRDLVLIRQAQLEATSQ